VAKARPVTAWQTTATGQRHGQVPPASSHVCSPPFFLCGAKVL